MDSLYKKYLDQSRSLSTQERICAFLNHILQIFQDNYYYLEENPQNKSKIVYSELTKYGLNSSKDFEILENNQFQTIDIKQKGYFYRWTEYFKDNYNIRVFCDEVKFPYWMQFKNGNLTRKDDFEKIYLSLDSDHIYRGVQELMEFMSQNNIEHVSKISSKQRADGIVIRLRRSDKESLDKIINFINHNEYIQEGLNQLNPFLPAKGNVAHILDNAESYNSIIAKFISQFIDKNINQKKIEYLAFLDDAYNIEEDNARQILITHLESFKKDYQIGILNSAIICTYKKHGFKQAEVALKEVINNDNFDYFTRYDGNNNSVNYREQLKKNLNSSEILNIVFQYFQNHNYPIDKYTNEEAINIFTSNAVMKYQMSILDKAVSLTCKNHDIDWAKQAIKGYINTESTKGFSRYEAENTTNYRELLGKYVNAKDIHRLAAMSLMEKGTDISNLDINAIIPTYIDIVSRENIQEYTR